MTRTHILKKKKHTLYRQHFHLRNISKVSTAHLEMIIHAFISSRIDYCNALFTSLSMSALGRLQAVQNAAARLLTRSNKRSHITLILRSLHWLPVAYRIQFKITLTYRALHGETPAYVADLIHPYTSARPLRSNMLSLLSVPRTHLNTCAD